MCETAGDSQHDQSTDSVNAIGQCSRSIPWRSGRVSPVVCPGARLPPHVHGVGVISPSPQADDWGPSHSPPHVWRYRQRGVFGNIGRRMCLEISAEGCSWRYRQKGKHEAWCKTLSLRIQRFGTYPGERDPSEDILRPTCRIPMSNPQEANSSSSKLWEVTTLRPVALVKQIVAPEMPRSLFRESKPDVILASE